MNFNTADLIVSLPEIFILVMTCFILVVELFAEERGKSVAYGFSQFTLVGALALSVLQTNFDQVMAYNNFFINDFLALVSKTFVYITTFFGFAYSREYLRERNMYKGEFFVLALFGVLGMNVMISGHNLLTLYMGLELLALSLYALVAFNRDSVKAVEAAMKYFVLGALASGMLLYGMSILYGVTGSLDLLEIAVSVSTGKQNEVVMAFALSFVIVGLAFKLGAVPFHMWVPDVYQGAPTPVTLYLGAAPKIAALVMTLRLLADGLGGLASHWQDMLVVLAVLSLAIGNLVAIVQTNIKRMLAYSTISHIGFLLLGILAGSKAGYSAALFYAITYTLTAAAGFGIILLLSRAGFEADEIADLKGLNQRSPWFAFLMLLVMFSMAGVPPMVGFYAKLVVLSAIIDQGLLWLAITAVVFSVIGAYYYLRILKVMYFEDPEQEAPAILRSMDMKVTLSFNSLLIVVLGIFPGGLMSLCLDAIG